MTTTNPSSNYFAGRYAEVRVAALAQVWATGTLLCEYEEEPGPRWDALRGAHLALREALGLTDDLTDTVLVYKDWKP